MAIGATQSPAARAGDDLGEHFYEIIGGQVFEKPLMSAHELWIASRLIWWLISSQADAQLGQVVAEMLFVIDKSKDLRRRPDIAFVSRDRWPIEKKVERNNAWDVVPDLAVEIVSPTNSADEVMEKLEEYFAAGSKLVWVVYPITKKIYVYDSPDKVRILKPGNELDGGAILPGFRLPIDRLFGTD